ncbi:MAG: RluA family pseudouridine synthase [Treponema sp.]|nr:RluA family pseudouridine synthase [Treponema sp.]
MFPPFDEEKALEKCRWLAEKLDSGEAVLRQLSAVSGERAGQGLMLAAMVARDEDGKEGTYFACSGLSRQLQAAAPELAGSLRIAPPIVPPEAVASALAKNDREIHELTDRLAEGDGDALPPDRKEELKRRRRALTDESLDAVFSLYRFHCADGRLKGLKEACSEYARHTGKGGSLLPPTGTGECAEQKLLDLAFSQGLTPVSLAEVFYCAPDSPDAAKRGLAFPPCDSRCGIVLPAMLGLEILWRDTDIIVVNKQSGLLSVPGRGPDKQDCIVNRVKRLFPDCMEQPAAHRLDMETSGLMVLTFNPTAHRELSRQFQEGEVSKEYTALLDGVLACKGIAATGVMELTFRLDVDNRPHQIWDSIYGKKSITEWTVERVQDYHAPDGSSRPATRVLFRPRTGRTHQLRLASADPHGFGVPIIGDTLYGTCAEGERLMLHASRIVFTHPGNGRKMEFTCPAPF